MLVGTVDGVVLGAVVGIVLGAVLSTKKSSSSRLYENTKIINLLANVKTKWLKTTLIRNKKWKSF